MKSERQDPRGGEKCENTQNERDMTEDVVTPDTVTGEAGTPEDLEERLAEAEAKASENWNMYLRALADLENFRRRTARDLAFHIRSGKKDMILKLLTVVDDMERALAAEADYEALREGVEMITRKLLDILSAEGVKPIEAVGLPFDPNFHEAVVVCDDRDVDIDTVVEEFRRGYTYEDEVIRATMAHVARPADD
jgi:molecular chaperone GrpE